MIDEKKMIDAFDLLETLSNLSDVYHQKDIEKDVFANFIGCNKILKVRFVDWSKPGTCRNLQIHKKGDRPL